MSGLIGPLFCLFPSQASAAPRNFVLKVFLADNNLPAAVTPAKPGALGDAF